MAEIKDRRSHGPPSAPRCQPAREHDREHEHGPRVARPVPDFDEVSADDELGSDENQIHQRRASRCDEED